MNIDILENIEPFNDIWYKNCFYSSLFPIVLYFNKTITPYLFNELYFYSYDSDEMVVGQNTVKIAPEYSLLESIGILKVCSSKCVCRFRVTHSHSFHQLGNAAN